MRAHYFILILSNLFSLQSDEPIEFWELENLPQKEMKQVHTRGHTIVWKTKQTTYQLGDEYFIKIWEPQRKRSHAFLKAFKLGVFDGTTPLRAIIFDSEQRCRGYVTYATTQLIPRLSLHRLQKLFNQDQVGDGGAFTELLEKMREKTITTGFVFGDISYKNLGMRNGECLLFDLDGIIPLRLYASLEKRRLWNSYKPYFKDPELLELNMKRRKN